MTIWLASVAGERPRLMHGRWLTPRVLERFGNRLGWDAETSRVSVDSERGRPFLAFLHYVAAAADLVDAGGLTVETKSERLQYRHLLVAPAGWTWAAAPYDQRLRRLWQSWLNAPDRLGYLFREDLADFPRQARRYLTDPTAHELGNHAGLLSRLPTDRFVALSAFLEQVRLGDARGVLPPSDEKDVLAAVCLGPLFWLGLLDVARPVDPLEINEAAVRLTAMGAWLLGVRGWGPPADTAPKSVHSQAKRPDLLTFPLKVQPLHLLRLAPYSEWMPRPKSRESG